MKFILINLILLFPLSIYGQSQIKTEDLKTIVGSWEGKITYLDYQTNKPFTMAANLIAETGKNENSLVLKNIYPNEPRANNYDKIKITKNGTLLNGNLVTRREELEDGQVKIQTEHKGKDDHKKALIRYTYLISEDIFLIRKDVFFNFPSITKIFTNFMALKQTNGVL
jgi:hypothetical protein